MNRAFSTPSPPILSCCYLRAPCALCFEKHTPILTRFAASCADVPKSCKFAPLFSITSTMPLLQPLSFHVFALLPRVGMPLQQKHSTKMTPSQRIEETT